VAGLNGGCHPDGRGQALVMPGEGPFGGFDDPASTITLVTEQFDAQLRCAFRAGHLHPPANHRSE